MELLVLLGLGALLAVLAAPIMCIFLFTRVGKLERELTALRFSVAASGSAAATSPAPSASPSPVSAPVAAQQAPTPAATMPPAPSSPPPTTVPPAAPTPAAPPREPVDMSARVLAIGGALFVIAATALFLALAISSGWLTRELQVLLTFVGGVALVAAGIWAYERDDDDLLRGGRQIAEIVAGAGFAVLQLGCFVGAQGYELLDPAVGLFASLLIGVATVAIAWRWNAHLLAGFGIVTGLAAPIIVGAEPDALTLAFLSIAAVAAVVACTLREWAWLTTAVLVVTAPQLATWVDDRTLVTATATAGVSATSELTVASLVVIAWWLLLVIGACAWQLRAARKRLDTQAAVQLFAASGAAVGMLVVAVDNTDLSQSLPFVLLGFALLHVLLGIVFSARWSEQGRALGILMASVGAGIAAGGIAVRFDGPATVAFWTVEFLALLWVRLEYDDRRAGLIAGVFGVMALGHTLILDAPPQALLYSTDAFGGAFVALSIVIIGAWLGAELARRIPDASEFGDALVAPQRIARWCILIAVSLVWYLASLSIVWLLTPTSPTTDAYGFVTEDVSQSAQLALSLFWALCGLAAVQQGIARSIDLLRHVGIALFGIVAAKVLLLDTAQLESGYRVLSFLVVGLLLLGGGYLYSRRDKLGPS